MSTGMLSLPAYPQGYRLETPQLVLRAPGGEDAEKLWPLVSDSRLSTFLAWEPHRSIDETAAMVAALIDAQCTGTGFHWIASHADEVVGLISLIDVRREHRSWTLNRAELAYWIGLPFQGMGYATEAAAAVMEFGFEKLHLHKIRVYHAADNPASGRTIDKLGFRFVGEEKEAFQKNGVWHHLRHFELLCPEFSAMNGLKQAGYSTS
jgi:ribosomal-protein-alanine N-acetyltransferase